MIKIASISIAIILVISIQCSTALECWMCKEKDFPAECGVTFTPTVNTKIQKIECEEACVTFKNKYDGGTIVRNCTAGLWVPPTGKVNMTHIHNVETCIKDKYSLELFCFCQKDLCNANNTGNVTIFNINECSSNPCVNGGTCEDLYNRYKCTCPGNYAEPNCATCKPGYAGTQCQQKLASPCLSGPCKNAGTCVEDIDKYTYKCECATGFNGTNCEIDINECLDIPCKNGGICKDLPGKYECNCANTGYTGTDCDKDVDECLDDPCDDNGAASCENTPGSFKCICEPGFTGRLCDEDIDECASNPCKNGTCTNLVNSYKCNCNKPYTGDQCESLINFCEAAPCKNGGECLNDYIQNKYTCACKPGYTGITCADEIDYCNTLFPCKFFTKCTNKPPGDWECTCRAGYSGKNCTIDINECESAPCKNNGKCLDQINAYTCICPAGYTGVNCETNIDECASSPCSPNGQCLDKVNGYTCTCELGYTGVRCETNIDECASAPCRNKGTCVDLINGYGCLCNTTYYTGKNCERPVLRCLEPDGVDPCNSNGICDGGVGYQDIICTCNTGYTGKFCETKISKCSTVKCLNGGTCIETATVTGYACSCNVNFTGSLCETRKSACKDQNINCFNGVCVDIGSSFECDCNDGYNGKYCTNKYFTCTEVGTFADPVYCESYFYCTAGATPGTFVLTQNICTFLSPYQLLYDSAKKNCVFPARHPNPGCYDPNKTRK